MTFTFIRSVLRFFAYDPPDERNANGNLDSKE